MIKRFSCIVVIISICGILPAREKINLDKGWEFAFGNASSPALDFGCGTEYFTYLTKAASIHNEGPYSQSFDKSKGRRSGRRWTFRRTPPARVHIPTTITSQSDLRFSTIVDL